MTKTEAYKVLGASVSDDDRTIRIKYKKLLFLHHPDSNPGKAADPRAEEKIRRIIEAYRVIKNSDEKVDFSKEVFSWRADTNPGAFCDRTVYMQIRIYDDEELPLTKAAVGKYLWDPDLEEFPLFTKSILEAVRELASEAMFAGENSGYGHNTSRTIDAEAMKQAFHLLMQEFVAPAECARKLGEEIQINVDNPVDKTLKRYAFSGYVKTSPDIQVRLHEGEPLDVFLSENMATARAIAQTLVTGQLLGQVTFDDDALYYVVLPLLEDPEVEVRTKVLDVTSLKGGAKRVAIKIELIIPEALVDQLPDHNNVLKSILGM